jgi:hypothetical protein
LRSASAWLGPCYLARPCDVHRFPGRFTARARSPPVPFPSARIPRSPSCTVRSCPRGSRLARRTLGSSSAASPRGSEARADPIEPRSSGARERRGCGQRVDQATSPGRRGKGRGSRQAPCAGVRSWVLRTPGPRNLGWLTGFEPAASRATTWRSNRAELQPPHPRLARLKGFEPLTRSLEGCRSIQLSYRRPDNFKRPRSLPTG